MKNKILLLALMLFYLEPQLAYADCPDGKWLCKRTHETFKYGKCFNVWKGGCKTCNPAHIKKIKERCASSQDGREWMKEIDDNHLLSQIAIPGTHDSGAYNMPDVLGKDTPGECQDLNIKKQLELGIRFLDIRIADTKGAKSNRYEFEIRHGPQKLGNFQRLVMAPVNAYLDTHPSETILMSIKPEADYLDTKKLKNSVIFASGTKFITDVSNKTTLGEVRGKIVLINRIEDKHLSKSDGIAWSSITGHGGLQDKYELDTDGFMSLDYNKKARQALSHLDKAKNNYGAEEYWVSFASASMMGTFIPTTAEWVNPKIKNYFSTLTESGEKIGAIVPMDYPNRTPGLVGSIIGHSISQARLSKGAHQPPAEQVACVSYGLGSRGIPTAGRCEVVAPERCIVPRGLVGGGKRAYPGKTCAKALELHRQQLRPASPPAKAPQIKEVAWRSHPTLPSGLKPTCQTTKRSMCPVMKWEGYTYWAFSHRDNRLGMTIVAYDANGKIVKQWPKIGARYVSGISANDKTVTFTGQAGRTISMSLDELRLAH